MSNIYVTATPIGNLEDITLRALRILKEVDVILCEDTRVTKKLLSHFDIKTPTMSYHSNSKLSKVEKIFELLKEGKDLALVSDAGTPTISDPGSKLISEIREELPDVNIVSVPGPSALVSALSIAGVKSAEFIFLGFLPHKKGRETIFKEIANEKRTVVFYESPHRILKALESLRENSPQKDVTIAREITKLYEEVLKGKAGELLAMLEENPVKQKGEFVVIVNN
ncbi:MAG: 16S rRNA (cytidine1402-2'-O)-methyltransferase [Candidatus Paceibacteria bacterium]|jgi:16S rRNA (cytidine1402-2'-O)-methyltransferase